MFVVGVGVGAGGGGVEGVAGPEDDGEGGAGAEGDEEVEPGGEGGNEVAVELTDGAKESGYGVGGGAGEIGGGEWMGRHWRCNSEQRRTV